MPWNKWWTRPRSLSFDTTLESPYFDEKLPAHFEVRWSGNFGSKKHHKPEAVIREHVRNIAGGISIKQPITRFKVTEDRINSALGTPRDICNESICLVWVEVRITQLDSDVLQRSYERARIRETALQRDRMKQDEIRHVEAFRSKVLADPGMALAYWFMQNPGKLTEDSYGIIENLSRQIASYDPNNRWVQISRIIEVFVEGLTESERRQSIETLRLWIMRHGMHQLADRLPQESDNDS